MDGETDLSDFFQEPEFFDAANFSSTASSPQDDLFAVLQAWESSSTASDCNPVKTLENDASSFEFQKSACVFDLDQSDQPKCKKQKMNPAAAHSEDGQQRMSHITVERNRRKQMNEHLSVLRSLMPCFYVKRGDQASIIGGVVNYINELQQILHSLEAKKQRKAYAEVLSPRPASSPLMSPRKPPLSPRLSLPISPRTPQPSSPYKPWMHQQYPSGYHLNSPTTAAGGHMELQLHSPCNSSTNSSINDAVNELVATSKSAVAEVEVKFAGPNLVLKTASLRIPGQAGKIVSILEELALEILQVKISTVDETMLNIFTIKIGIECQLSAEELAQQIQKTFC